jgi:hypothetical protein
LHQNRSPKTEKNRDRSNRWGFSLRSNRGLTRTVKEGTAMYRTSSSSFVFRSLMLIMLVLLILIPIFPVPFLAL